MKVPPINERPKIIEKAHLLGHFNAQSTLSRIKLQYFWVKMALDVIQFVHYCLKCYKLDLL
jgi:hypothetical protein